MRLSFALVAAVLASTASALPSNVDSNAARLAAGLPIKAPRKLFDPARASTAEKPKRSVQPGVTFTCPAGNDFAECCTDVSADNTTGSGCDGNFSTTNTCSPGTYGVCCDTVILSSPATASGCFDPLL